MKRLQLFTRRSSYTFNFTLISSITAVITVLAYSLLHRYVNLILLLFFIPFIIVTISSLLAKLLVPNERIAIDRIEYVLKSAYNGDYTARIEYDEQDVYREWYQACNDFLEQTEQKLAYIQVLGEAKVMQDAVNVETAIYEERKRLARDLHDSVSQQLFAIHMCASSLQKLNEINPNQAAEVMGQLVKMSSHAQQQMRKFIAHLRPMELEDRSLSEALHHWFPDYCRQNQLQGRLDYRIKEKLSDAKEQQIFLIIQEAMANIVKHAKCTECYLTLYETEKRVIVTLEDNGIGFNREALVRKSYGLMTMKERAQKLSGDTEIISKEGSGTVVKVMIPKLLEKEAKLEYGAN